MGVEQRINSISWQCPVIAWVWFPRVCNGAPFCFIEPLLLHSINAAKNGMIFHKRCGSLPLSLLLPSLTSETFNRSLGGFFFLISFDGHWTAVGKLCLRIWESQAAFLNISCSFCPRLKRKIIFLWDDYCQQSKQQYVNRLFWKYGKAEFIAFKPNPLHSHLSFRRSNTKMATPEFSSVGDHCSLCISKVLTEKMVQFYMDLHHGIGSRKGIGSGGCLWTHPIPSLIRPFLTHSVSPGPMFYLSPLTHSPSLARSGSGDDIGREVPVSPAANRVAHHEESLLRLALSASLFCGTPPAQNLSSWAIFSSQPQTLPNISSDLRQLWSWQRSEDTYWDQVAYAGLELCRAINCRSEWFEVD